MIRDSDRLAKFERQDKQRVLRDMSYLDALAIFESLWEEARVLNPNSGKDWRSDIEPVLAVARAVNGLPPKS